jgi:hypothetical protein
VFAAVLVAVLLMDLMLRKPIVRTGDGSNWAGWISAEARAMAAGIRVWAVNKWCSAPAKRAFDSPPIRLLSLERNGSRIFA